MRPMPALGMFNGGIWVRTGARAPRSIARCPRAAAVRLRLARAGLLTSASLCFVHRHYSNHQLRSTSHVTPAAITSLYSLSSGAIIVGDRDDVAFRHAHLGYLFVQHNGLVIADQRGVSLLSLAVDCPRLAFQQMGCKVAAPAGKLRCAFGKWRQADLVPKNVGRIHRDLTKRGMIPR
jgi:hypothetical protein